MCEQRTRLRPSCSSIRDDQERVAAIGCSAHARIRGDHHQIQGGGVQWELFANGSCIIINVGAGVAPLVEQHGDL